MNPLKTAAFAAVGLVVAGAVVAGTHIAARLQAYRAMPTLHYAPNRNFGPHDAYLPASLGFDLADVSSPQQLAALPAGVEGLVWVGMCGGADAGFIKKLAVYAGHRNLFGFYLADDPSPSHGCPPAHLRTEADWVHAHFPHAKTFIAMMNLGRSQHPWYRGSYTPGNSHIDLFGIAPYPCRIEWERCDFPMIGAFVSAAEAAGIPRDRIVPIYQAFGGGHWSDDQGGAYAVPSQADAEHMFEQWHTLVPHPVFDMAYSWGSQQGDAALADAPPGLRTAFAQHNRREQR